MKFRTKYRLCLWYKFWGQGVGLTQPIKYFIIFFGITSIALPEWIDPRWTLGCGIIWMITCFFIGRAWYKYGWREAENEVGNMYNKFVKEMRRKHGRKK